MRRKSVKGSCLCGGVVFQASFPSRFCSHCHCSNCRKAHGAAYVTYLGVRDGRLKVLSGGRLLSAYEYGYGYGGKRITSTRKFCRRCGSTVFFSSTRWPGGRMWRPGVSMGRWTRSPCCISTTTAGLPGARSRIDCPSSAGPRAASACAHESLAGAALPGGRRRGPSAPGRVVLDAARRQRLAAVRGALLGLGRRAADRAVGKALARGEHPVPGPVLLRALRDVLRRPRGLPVRSDRLRPGPRTGGIARRAFRRWPPSTAGSSTRRSRSSPPRMGSTSCASSPGPRQARRPTRARSCSGPIPTS